MDTDPTSPMDIFLHDEYRRKCIEKVVRAQNEVKYMPTAQLKGICKKSLETPAQLKKKFKGLLDTLKMRFERATNEKEGGCEFREDINQIQMDMQQVMDAGIAGSDAVRFCRYEERKINLDF